MFEGCARTTYMYRLTLTGSGGLLLGAGAAFVWRPWRWARAADAPAGGIGAWSAWHACCAELAASSGSSGTNMCLESAAGRTRESGEGEGWVGPCLEETSYMGEHGAAHIAGCGDTSVRSRAELWAVS